MTSHTRRGRRARVLLLITAGALVLAFLPGIQAGATPPAGNPATYTLDTHFSEGSLINVNYTDVPDQLQMNSAPTPFNFIWVAASTRGTIVKIDTQTGTVLGEYLSAPEGRGYNPSRTTVDANGNVWAGNRAEAGFIGPTQYGSVVKIGLEENGQCVDRDGSGTIDTSTGLGDVKLWPDVTDGVGSTDGAPHVAQVQDAADECILIYQRTPNADEVRHVSVDAGNDVWVGGYPFAQRFFHQLDETTGAILNSFDAATYGCGGYGGLIDGNNVLWSASISQSQLLRYDLTAGTGSCIPVGSSYGLGIDTSGFVWNSMWVNDSIVKVSPAGAIQAGFPKPTGGAGSDRGVAVTPIDDNVWVANSGGSDVSRLDNAGTFLNAVPVGSNPTGVAVDAAGKVWATNLGSHNVSRINPATNMVDLTVDLNAVKYNGVDAGPYNYSDMTGSTLIAPPTTGTWEFEHDSGLFDAPWQNVSWSSLEPGPAGSITVTVASSNVSGGPYSAPETVTNGVDLTSTPPGQYLKVVVTFSRADGFDPTPVLYDLTLLYNRPPDCSQAFPSVDRLWPPNHKFHDVNVLGVTDPDGDPFTITIDSIFQDEMTDTSGDGAFAPDGMGVGSDTAEVRAERSGNPKEPGNGRVYYIGFTADDGIGGTCEAVVEVGVPHDVKDTPIGEGPLFDSTI